ncbi:MAG: sugar phosphate nucleotidyltransferase [Patescibacteria group bacterium]
MKGIILAGGSGSRLAPLTKVTSKQLLPIYNKPMIYYPLNTLLEAGINEILFIVAPEHAGDYVNFLGSGREFNARFSFEVQDKPLGLAHGLSLAENFVNGETCCMILGDNIFLGHDFKKDVSGFTSGAKIYVKEVPDPERFGVAEFDAEGHVISIEEKPKNPKTNFAQVGMYMYDEPVFDLIKTMKPSDRGELEITDLNNIYLNKGVLTAEIMTGNWIDAGTFESLHKAAILIRERELNEK